MTDPPFHIERRDNGRGMSYDQVAGPYIENEFLPQLDQVRDDILKSMGVSQAIESTPMSNAFSALEAEVLRYQRKLNTAVGRLLARWVMVASAPTMGWGRGRHAYWMRRARRLKKAQDNWRARQAKRYRTKYGRTR